MLPGIEPDGDRIWTYFEAMMPEEHAEIAGGHGLGRHRHGVRLFYRSLGAEVTIIELLPQILPVEDAEIAAHARRRSKSAASSS